MKFVREIHVLAVQNLSHHKEGALHPGNFRQGNVKISGAEHVPPDYTQVEGYMQELVDFINKDDPQKYDLLKIAIAHHRFVWIHPFENGNGRVVRLFTYLLLLKKVFTNKERIINPTAVFCSNRENYYRHLGMADSGDDKGLLDWCAYVLAGLKEEIQKIDKLIDYEYLRQEILLPALQDARKNAYVTPAEYSVLKKVVDSDRQIVQARDLSAALSGKGSSDISRIIRALLDKKMLKPEKPNARKYGISFSNNYLLRSILRALDKKGFLPIQDN